MGSSAVRSNQFAAGFRTYPASGTVERTHKSGERMYARIIRARSSKARKSHALILAGNPLALVCLEPISKSPEEDNEASELYEAEEVPGVVFPTDEDAALPLNPSKEALHEPASHIAAQPSPILRGRLASVAAMRRDHLDAVLAQLLIEWIAIVGAIANQILRLGLDHVEVKA